MRDMRISLRWNEYLRILRHAALYTIMVYNTNISKNFLPPTQRSPEKLTSKWRNQTSQKLLDIQAILEIVLYQMTEIFISIVFLSLWLSHFSLLHCLCYRVCWKSRVLLIVLKISYFFGTHSFYHSLWQTFIIRSCLPSPHQHTHTHTRSSFNIIILYMLMYTKFASSLEYFDRKYEWISHFSEASYMPRKIRPCWLSYCVDILKKLQIMNSDIIQLSPAFVSILF